MAVRLIGMVGGFQAVFQSIGCKALAGSSMALALVNINTVKIDFGNGRVVVMVSFVNFEDLEAQDQICYVLVAT